ncbi:MAG: hypothetical protein EOP06_18695 [Proteobacteria bacterium]|nr:MAG: hypothetical protein EOP06_18695 [Pseudomonadota bacterium]
MNAPFLLAQPSNDEFCHVIDEVALDRILRFLDTAPDFIRYIDQKQRFLSEVAIVDASSEQDILAWYLTTYNDEEEHAFPTFSSSSAVTVPKHLWNSFENSAQYGAWMEANRISYGYDDIIERFFRHHTQGTQYFREHQLGTAQMKLLLRFFASMDRFQRRIISEKISSWVHVIRGKTDFRFTTVIIPTRPQSPFMGILVMSKLSYAPEYADFRKARRTLLEGLAHAIKHVYPRAEDILCLAIDSSPDGQSEDALYLDAREWSPEQAEIGRSMHEDAGLLANTRVDKKDRWEFPVYEEQTLGNSVRKQGRNDRCQCGSGKKFKNCCLKNLYD